MDCVDPYAYSTDNVYVSYMNNFSWNFRFEYLRQVVRFSADGPFCPLQKVLFLAVVSKTLFADLGAPMMKSAKICEAVLTDVAC